MGFVNQNCYAESVKSNLISTTDVTKSTLAYLILFICKYADILVRRERWSFRTLAVLGHVTRMFFFRLTLMMPCIHAAVLSVRMYKRNTPTVFAGIPPSNIELSSYALALYKWKYYTQDPEEMTIRRRKENMSALDYLQDSLSTSTRTKQLK